MNYVAAHHHLIPGDPGRSQNTPIFERTSPVDGRLIATVTKGTRSDALRAIAIARAEFDSGSWPSLPGTERTRVLLRWAELIASDGKTLAGLDSAEVGKPVRSAEGDVDAMVSLVERAAYAASDLHGESYDDMGQEDFAFTRREPVGVVGAIVPWNFPGVLFVQKAAFALAAGCTVVAKPSEFTSGSALHLARLAYEAGVPREALLIVTGLGADVGAPLAESTDVDALTFTGSTRTGALLSATPRPFPQRQYFELGGKGATIVFDDADLAAAVDGTLTGFCANQGENCVAGTRLLVHQEIADEFVQRLAAAAGRLKVGDPQDPDTDLGPLIHEAHRDAVLARVREAEESGATVITSEPARMEHVGAYVWPTIVRDAGTSHPIFTDEIFGPVLAVEVFRNLDEAVAIANSTAYGLANSVWTNDYRTALMASRRLRSGMVWVNDVQADRAALPFGGRGASGFGREKGAIGVEEFTDLKTVTFRINQATPQQR